jgi:hypothetical protein
MMEREGKNNLNFRPIHDKLWAMMDDKRKFLRFECLIPVEEIQSQGLNGQAREVALDNVSREGVRLIMDVDTAFVPGTDVRFRINLAADRSPIFVRGTVMWSRPKEERFEIGVRIVEMDKAAKAELLDIGFERWKEEKTPPRAGSMG